MDKAIFENTMKALFNFARTRGIAFFLASLMLLFAVSCQRYVFPQITPERIVKIDKNRNTHKRFLIYDAQGHLYELKNLEMNSSGLVGTLQHTSGPFYPYLKEKSYTNVENEVMLNDVHIFLSAKYDTLALGAFVVPLRDISEVRIIKRPSPLGPIVAVVGGIVLLLFIGVVAAISSLSQ